MKHSYRFFANTDCEYYPCHEGAEELNCLFCYCPLYGRAHCPGTPEFIPNCPVGEGDASALSDSGAVAEFIPGHSVGEGDASARNGQTAYIKSCMNCTFPHRAENYDIIMQFLKKGGEAPGGEGGST